MDLKWFKSEASASNGGCAEVAWVPAEDDWKKAEASGQNVGCAEVALNGGIAGVAMRNSTDPSGPELRFTPHEWDCFIDGVKKGEFDRPLA